MGKVALMTGGKGESERSETDYYPTPLASIESLFKTGLIPQDEIHTFWEPAAGGGHIGRAIQDWFPSSEVIMTDMYDYGCCDVIPDVDFLTEKLDHKVDWIVTNPPYDQKILMPFVEKAIEKAKNGVAMFLKITFLESSRRHKFFTENSCLKRVVLFSNRQPMYKNGVYTNGSNAIMYAWFVWDKSYYGLPQIEWADNTARVKELREKDIY